MQGPATNRILPGVKSSAGRAPAGHHVSLLVRCLIEHRRGQWQGFTLEYGLAVQGDSESDVRRRLASVLLSYLCDALVGVDRDHAETLLSRRATWPVYARYYWFKVFALLSRRDGRPPNHKAYREPLALEPRMCSP